MLFKIVPLILSNMKIIIHGLVICFLFVGALQSYSQMSVINCLQQPVYKENGGYKKTTIFNKGKVKRESVSLLVCQLLEQTKIQTRTSSRTEYKNGQQDATYNEIEKAIKETNQQILEIAKKLDGKKINSHKEYEKVLEILKELNDLKCRRIDPIRKFLDKKIYKIYGDISFSTGSSVVSGSGKKEIKNIVNQIRADINEWRQYVSDCNEKVFENDLFVLVIDIDGYADQQGSTESNQNLSEERAKAVKTEIIKHLNDLIIVEKINLVFDKIQARGFGEQLPPSLSQRGENDPLRRVCLINSLVGPSSILK